MRNYRPHRLVIPVTALFALVLLVSIFHALDGRMTSPNAVYVAASISFVVTAVIGFAFKPLLGE